MTLQDQWDQWIQSRHPNGIEMTPETLAAEIVAFVLDDLHTRYPGRDEDFYQMGLSDFAQYFHDQIYERYGIKDTP